MVAGSIIRRIVKSAARHGKRPTPAALRSKQAVSRSRRVRRIPNRTRPGAGVYVGAGGSFDPKGLSRELPRNKRPRKFDNSNPVAQAHIDELRKTGTPEEYRATRNAIKAVQGREHWRPGGVRERIQGLRNTDNTMFGDRDAYVYPNDKYLRGMGAGALGFGGLGFGSYFSQRRDRRGRR